MPEALLAVIESDSSVLEDHTDLLEAHDFDRDFADLEDASECPDF